MFTKIYTKLHMIFKDLSQSWSVIAGSPADEFYTKTDRPSSENFPKSGVLSYIFKWKHLNFVSSDFKKTR